MIDENINHPERYKCGKYECIDVMTDVFGVDAVKSFCKLNAFKYLWREEKKNGVEDLKKAEWYLNKLIEEIADVLFCIEQLQIIYDIEDKDIYEMIQFKIARQEKRLEEKESEIPLF